MLRAMRPSLLRVQGLRRVPPDVLAVAAISASGAYANGSLAAIIGLVGADFGVTFTALGVLTSGFAIARVLLDLPVGTLLDWLRPRTMFYAGGSAAIVGVLLSVTAPSFEMLVVGRVIHGLGAMLSTATATAYLARRATPAERGRMMGIAGAANPIGELLAPLSVGLLAAVAGWRTGLGAALVPAGLALLLVPRHVPRHRMPTGTVPALARVRTRRRAVPLRIHVILGINLLTAMTSLANFGYKSTLLPLYGGTALRLNSGLVGLTITAAAAVRVPLALWSGALSDRVGRLTVFVPGMLALIVAAPMLNLAGSVGPYVGFALIYAVGAASAHMVYTMLVDRAPQDRLGSALGTNQFFADVVTVGMPVALGAAIDAGGFMAASVAIAVCGAVAIAISLVVGETAPRRVGSRGSDVGSPAP